MYCRVCGAKIAEGSKFCNECGASQEDEIEIVEKHVKKEKLEVEKPPKIEKVEVKSLKERNEIRKKRKENTKKLMEEDKKHQKERNDKVKEYKNFYPTLALIVSAVSLGLCFAPIPLTWWSCILIFIVGFYGTYYARKARGINEEIYNRYRTRIHPSWIKISLILSCISMGIAFVLFLGIVF